jgi:tryptophan-rich sensory protein
MGILNRPDRSGLSNAGIAILSAVAVNGIIQWINPGEMSNPGDVPLQPPGYVIGIIWIVLFAAMVSARWLLIANPLNTRHTRGLLLWLLLLCLAYPFYTFGLRNNVIGLMGALSILVPAVFFVIQASSISRLAAGLDYLAGTLAHEYPRYYPDRSKNSFHRIYHALAFTLIDRSDTGRPMLAVSKLAGSAAAGFVGMAYLPAGYNDTVHAGQRAAGTLGGYVPTLLVGYATGNLLYEFTPEFKWLGRKLHLPFIPKDL